MAQDLRRIVISGKTATEVQGIGLREKIQEIAKDKGIKGFIRNIKGEPRVEIICDAEKSEELHNEIKSIFPKFDVKTPSDNLFDGFKEEFEVKKEDDLTEMVWGLQGAGKAFVGAEENREKRRKACLLKSIRQELVSISNHIADIRSKESSSGFRTSCIENFLKEPPLDNDIDELTINLSDLLDICSDTNSLLTDHASNEERVKKNIGSMEELIETINKNLGDMDGKNLF